GLDASVKSEFVGYDTLSTEDKLLALSDGAELCEVLEEGSEGTVVTGKTPFYATMGGQKGDIGVIKTGSGEFEVVDTVKLPGGRIGHVGRVKSGRLSVSDPATLKVDTLNRAKTCRNHSATHLLQSALRSVLGDGVEQAGSYQDPERTRFDFTYGQAMTDEEINKVQDIVNEKIAEGLEVETKVMNLEEAKKTGAMALFGEKYDEEVRVVSMSDFSKEFCGGTHVKNTADIITFKILSESGVAAGVRRIEALTGTNVFEYYRNVENTLKEAAHTAKTTPESLSEKIAHLMEENKGLKSELESLKSKAAQSSVGDAMSRVKEVKGLKFLATKVDGVDMNGLRDLSDKLRNDMGEGVVVLFSEADGKVHLVVSATEGAIKMGAHSGNLIKLLAPMVGGGGGGRPNMASAGGKNPAGIKDAIEKAGEILSGQLQG
nr:alanine--tRNA ligase [Lachnospiraceae bacterium]